MGSPDEPTMKKPPWKKTRMGSLVVVPPPSDSDPDDVRTVWMDGRYSLAATPVAASITTSLDVTPVSASKPAGTVPLPPVRSTWPSLNNRRNTLSKITSPLPESIAGQQQGLGLT